MKCVICNEKITADPFGWEGGCNAEPVKEGQCCYTCDISVVLPARLAPYGMTGEWIENAVSEMWKDIEGGTE